MTIDRRQFLQLAALGGGAVFASSLPGCATSGGANLAQEKDDFYFVQLSDSHWGFEGPKVNPEASMTFADEPPVRMARLIPVGSVSVWVPNVRL